MSDSPLDIDVVEIVKKSNNDSDFSDKKQEINILNNFKFNSFLDLFESLKNKNMLDKKDITTETEAREEIFKYFKGLTYGQKIKKLFQWSDMINNNSCSPFSKSRNNSCLSNSTLEKLVELKGYDIKQYQTLKSENADKYRLLLIGLIKKEYNINSGFEIYLELCRKLINKSYIFKDPAFEDVYNDKAFLDSILISYKPLGPIDGTWLDNFEIERVMKIYELYLNRDKKEDYFYFAGVYPSDFENYDDYKVNKITKEYLDDKKIKYIGIVFNHDKRTEPGSHWVALYIDLKNNKAYYYDSVGKKPKVEYKNFVKHIFKKCGKVYNVQVLDYNKTERQTSGGSCGIYAITFIISMAGGIKFEEYLNLILSPKFMKYLRLLYFNDKELIYKKY